MIQGHRRAQHILLKGGDPIQRTHESPLPRMVHVANYLSPLTLVWPSAYGVPGGGSLSTRLEGTKYSRSPLRVVVMEQTEFPAESDSSK